MTSFLFRALIYYHVKRNNASQLKRFLQKSRQSCPRRAQYKQNTPKNRRKHRLLHTVCPLAYRSETRTHRTISPQWDKIGLTCARNYAILRMEPPKERFRRANNPKVGSTPNIAAPLFSDRPKQLADAPQQHFDRLRRIDTKDLHALTSSCRICAKTPKGSKRLTVS